MTRLLGLTVAIVLACGPISVAPTPRSAPPSSSAATPAATTASPTAPPTALPKVSSSPSPAPIELPTFIAAAGNGVVWAFVNRSRLFLSHDRGATWNERTPPPDLINGNIAFVDEMNGWGLVAGSPATGCMAQGSRVVRTTDGARTWRVVFESAFPSSVAAGCKTNIAFSDALHGYIGASTRDSGSWVLRSSDGGTSWTPSSRFVGPIATDPTRTPSYVNAPGPIADFGGALFVATSTQLGPQVPRSIFRSSDRGATWQYAGSPPEGSITFLTPTHWIAWRIPELSAETTDGGSTWHAFRSEHEPAIAVEPRIVFGDAHTGYAAVGRAILRTVDGGAHWTRAASPGP